MKRVAFILLPLFLAPVAEADDSTAVAREVRAVRASSSIALDGMLSEPAWQGATPIDWFTQKDPNQGSAPSQRTEVRVLYDDDALYLGARMHDAKPDSIVRLLVRRDGQGRSDLFKVYLDPYFDRRSGYYFAVNAAGTLYDGTLYNDSWNDDSWDGVWDARAKVDAEGWTAEMRIPFCQIRFAKGQAQTWGINFNRSMGRDFEDDYLVYQPRNESGFVSRFPTLVGLEGVTPGGAIEVVPFLTSKAEYLRHEAFDPFNDGSRYRANLGGDLRMALGSKLTVNGTINPDFGQVEVDPAVVNLSDFETFFPEKRPFFVEGSSNFSAGQQGASDYWGFNWPQPTFFYSRRIGRAPQGNLPDDAQFSQVPSGTTILGAAKVSGKLAEGLSVGMLHALTQREHADIERTDTSRFESEVEPMTYYGVGRALKEFGERRRGLGVLTTVTARRFDDSQLERELSRTALTGVMDGWQFLDPGKTWVMSGWTGATYVEGSKDVITSLQTGSRRYFQRPDAENYSLDPGATALGGYGARVYLNKEKGRWLSNSALGVLSPGFETNDLGFQTRADVVNGHAGVGYRWTAPTRYVKHHLALGALFGSSNYDGDLIAAGVWGKHFWWFTNNWTFELRGAYNPETVNPRRSRGGPLMLNAPGYETGTFFDTDGSRVRYYYLSTYTYTQPDENSYYWEVEPGFTWKPVSNVSLSLAPNYSESRDGAFYVTTLSDPTATSTYGARYVFAQLDQRTLAASVRMNVSFTPTISLQFYGQPYITTADFSNYRELARPRSLDFVGPGAGAWTYDPATDLFDPDGAGTESPSRDDFNFKSLRGNAVFRWEYVPGATLFLVWTQQRTQEDVTSAFDIGPSFRQLGRADADNIFLAKVTYYLNR